MNANRKLIIERWQDETALSRFKMIAPLCDETIDPAKRVLRERTFAVEDGRSEVVHVETLANAAPRLEHQAITPAMRMLGMCRLWPADAPTAPADGLQEETFT